MALVNQAQPEILLSRHALSMLLGHAMESPVHYG